MCVYIFGCWMWININIIIIDKDRKIFVSENEFEWKLWKILISKPWHIILIKAKHLPFLGALKN